MNDQSIPEKAPLPALQHVWAMVTPVQDLPGRLVKRVQVPPGGVAVAENRDGSTRVLDKGSVPVGGAWYRLSHLSAPQTTAVAVMNAASMTLHPSVTNLLTADGELVEADWLVTLEVADAGRVYSNVIRSEQVVPLPKITVNLGAQADSTLRNLVRDHTLQDLQYDVQVLERISASLASFLRSYLSGQGFRIVALEHLTFQRMADQVERAAKLRELQQQLRDEKLRAQMQLIKEQYQLREFADKLEQEYQVGRLFHQEELDALWQDIQSKAIEPAQIAVEIEKQVVEKAQEAEERVETRQEQLAERLEAAAAPAAVATETPLAVVVDDAGLRKWVKYLRYLGTLVFWGASVVAVLWPQLFGNEQTLRLVTALAGFLVGVLSLISSEWVGTMVREKRSQWLAQQVASGLSAAEQARADQLLRMSTAGFLRRAVDHVRGAKDTVLRAGERNLAADLKQVENRLGTLAQQAEVMAPAFAAQGAAAKRSTVELAAQADVEEKLLAFAESLANLAAKARETAQAGPADAARPFVPQIENAALEVKNLFEDRQRLLESR